METRDQAMTPSANLRARLLAQVHDEPSPTRDHQRRLGGLIILGVSVLVGLEFVVSGGVRLGTRPPGFVAGTSLAWLLGIVTLLIALRSRGPLGLPGAVLWALAFASLAFPFGVGVVLSGVYPTTAVPTPGHPGLLCLELSLAWSTAPLTAWVFVRRESDPVHPIAAGAAIGALAGCISGFLVNLTCTFADSRHLALGHLFPGLIQVGVGAMMGHLVLSIRDQRNPQRTWATLGAALGGWVAMMGNNSIQRECPTQIQPRQVVCLVLGLALGAIAGGWLGARRVRA